MNRLLPLPMAHWLTAVFVFCTLFAQSQDSLNTEPQNPDHLTYEKNGWDWYVKQNGRVLSQDELFNVLKNDYESGKYVRKYKAKKTIGTVLGVVGGAFIGFPVGQVIVGSDPQWVVALAGIGVLVIAIPLAISTDKDIRKGVDVYNQNLGPSAQLQIPVLRLGGQRHGLGLALRF